MDVEEGFLDLEEVEGVEVVYEGDEGGGGKVVRFRVGRDGEEDGEVEDVGSEEGEDEDGDGEYDLPPDEEELAVLGPAFDDEEDEAEVVDDTEVVDVEDVDVNVDVDVEEEVEEVKLVETFDGMSFYFIFILAFYVLRSSCSYGPHSARPSEYRAIGLLSPCSSYSLCSTARDLTNEHALSYITPTLIFVSHPLPSIPKLTNNLSAHHTTLQQLYYSS